MQWIIYGYGTGWLWYYYPLIAIQTLASFALIYCLRFSTAAWYGNRAVQVLNVATILAKHSQLAVPLPGCMANGFLYLVPFQKPLWFFVWIYLEARFPFYMMFFMN